MAANSPQGQFSTVLDDVLNGREPVAVTGTIGALITTGFALASHYGYVLADGAADLWFTFATLVLIAVIKPLRGRVMPVTKIGVVVK
jgi:threonine/homoserine efflux transporter RhtA